MAYNVDTESTISMMRACVTTVTKCTFECRKDKKCSQTLIINLNMSDTPNNAHSFLRRVCLQRGFILYYKCLEL